MRDANIVPVAILAGRGGPRPDQIERVRRAVAERDGVPFYDFAEPKWRNGSLTKRHTRTFRIRVFYARHRMEAEIAIGMLAGIIGALLLFGLVL